MKSNFTNTTAKNTSSLLSIKSAILVTGLGLALAVFTSCKKPDTPLPAQNSNNNTNASYGTLHYTMKNHAGTFTRDEQLNDNSICSIGKESTLSIQDERGYFYIGIVKEGDFSLNGTYCQTGSACSSNNSYSVAKYTWKDPHTGTVTALSFEEGESTITEFHPTRKEIKVYFSYSLHDPNFNNELVTVQGYATLHKIISPLGTASTTNNATY